jgi:hypothetical protein
MDTLGLIQEKMPTTKQDWMAASAFARWGQRFSTREAKSDPT